MATTVIFAILCTGNGDCSKTKNADDHEWFILCHSSTISSIHSLAEEILFSRRCDYKMLI